MPDILWQSIENRYQQEINQILDSIEGKESALITRERNNLLKGIGLLVSILLDEKEKHSKNSDIRISASQIARLMMNKAEYLGIDQEGLKSFDRKITAAVALINQDTDKQIIL